jgi:hypothetical protein
MNKNSYRGLQAHCRAMGGEACAPSGRQRPGQAAAVAEVLGDVAGARPGHPSESSRIVHVTIRLLLFVFYKKSGTTA